MSGCVRVVLGLGSSLGDRSMLLVLGARALAAVPGLDPVAVSRIYWSPPAGGVARGGFLNAALAADWSGDPLALLAQCQAVERRLGRRRGRRWADRTLDVDLLWIRGCAIAGERLAVPHPRLRDRPFALIPLLEVAPDAVDPRTGRPFGAPMCRSPLVAVGVLPGASRPGHGLQTPVG